MADIREFGIRPDYRHRPEPTYFDDETGELCWQPDVYRMVATIAAATGRTTVVDLGCGSGSKLGDLTGLRVVAADFGQNLAEAKSHHPDVEFHEIDLGVPFDVPIDAHELAGAIVMSSDVIEHLPDPSPFVDAVLRAVALGALVVLSTPEREVTWGPDHLGPPPNSAHCREWSLAELTTWIERSAVAAAGASGTAPTVVAGLTRSNSASSTLGTIVLAVVPSAAEADQVAQVLAGAWPLGVAAAFAEQRQLIDERADEVERVRRSWTEEVDRRDGAWQEEMERSRTSWREEIRRMEVAFEAEIERQVTSWEREVAKRDEHIRDLKAWIDELERRLAGG